MKPTYDFYTAMFESPALGVLRLSFHKQAGLSADDIARALVRYAKLQYQWRAVYWPGVPSDFRLSYIVSGSGKLKWR